MTVGSLDIQPCSKHDIFSQSLQCKQFIAVSLIASRCYSIIKAAL